ncbi:hypothetical protein TIFTF001_023141 [Ficus carica]|uniref:Uncharacterized protein n=1 Tax=Ficus carica TaxID=3494 RepID=A0AA88AWK8_FICCA|nr:hypothetical protein TIFTF001_023141 [Ficus carica]
MVRSLTITSGHRREGRERDCSDLRRQLVEEEDGRDLQFLISDANSSSQDYQACRVAS